MKFSHAHVRTQNHKCVLLYCNHRTTHVLSRSGFFAHSNITCTTGSSVFNKVSSLMIVSRMQSSISFMRRCESTFLFAILFFFLHCFLYLTRQDCASPTRLWQIEASARIDVAVPCDGAVELSILTSRTGGTE